ncbi:GNAT family N-acetyltransferase [Clostridium thailandense]|uniref:GNAT family N-acetyltransferase n=1 Tax=Clostridium thailandense TaxID=2794346 RepID=UPI003988C1B9
MISYRRCTEVDINLVFAAFIIGFSDYIVKIRVPKEFFVKRFFGPEGNKLELSFIALDSNKPVGIVLGGVKEYEGIKTMRCGAIALHPSYRGEGISQNLMRLHKEEAIKQGCKQLFLEVIAGNNRAISFYEDLNYEKVYDLNYYTLIEIGRLQRKNDLCLNITPMEVIGLKVIRKKILDVHINWQNDLEYLEQSEGQLTLAACIQNRLVGVISINKNSRINFLWVKNSFRCRGIATALISEGIKILNLSKVIIGFPNNSLIQGFVKHIGFIKGNIVQYEMYCDI